MPERGFASETWNSDEWFQDLDRDRRYLFIYLWTNDHCNQAGLYHITLTTISNETQIAKTELPQLLEGLSPKVVWYPQTNLIWVKNFLKRQAKSSKFLAAAAKSLTSIKDGSAISDFIEYNLSRYSISIPYQYYMDRISILTRDTDSSSVTDTVSVSMERKRVVKGEGKPQGENATPTSESEDDESLSPADNLVIDTWFSVKGFNLSTTDASELVTRIRTGFPRVDILAESKAWAVRKIAEPLTPESRITSQLWNWMKKADEIISRHRGFDKSDPNKYISGKYGHMVRR
jgi:hypothetical protein